MGCTSSNSAKVEQPKAPISIPLSNIPSSNSPSTIVNSNEIENNKQDQPKKGLSLSLPINNNSSSISTNSSTITPTSSFNSKQILKLNSSSTSYATLDNREDDTLQTPPAPCFNRYDSESDGEYDDDDYSRKYKDLSHNKISSLSLSSTFSSTLNTPKDNTSSQNIKLSIVNPTHDDKAIKLYTIESMFEHEEMKRLSENPYFNRDAIIGLFDIVDEDKDKLINEKELNDIIFLTSSSNQEFEAQNSAPSSPLPQITQNKDNININNSSIEDNVNLKLNFDDFNDNDKNKNLDVQEKKRSIFGEIINRVNSNSPNHSNESSHIDSPLQVQTRKKLIPINPFAKSSTTTTGSTNSNSPKENPSTPKRGTGGKKLVHYDEIKKTEQPLNDFYDTLSPPPVQSLPNQNKNPIKNENILPPPMKKGFLSRIDVSSNSLTSSSLSSPPSPLPSSSTVPPTCPASPSRYHVLDTGFLYRIDSNNTSNFSINRQGISLKGRKILETNEQDNLIHLVLDSGNHSQISSSSEIDAQSSIYNLRKSNSIDYYSDNDDFQIKGNLVYEDEDNDDDNYEQEYRESFLSVNNNNLVNNKKNLNNSNIITLKLKNYQEKIKWVKAINEHIEFINNT